MLLYLILIEKKDICHTYMSEFIVDLIIHRFTFVSQNKNKSH